MTLTAQHARGAGFLAAQHLHQNGIASIFPTALYAGIHFGATQKDRRKALDRAISVGWLERTATGAIKLGEPARTYFIQNEQEAPECVGKAASPRTGSAYDRPPLSKRFIPSSQGFRDDVPAFSVRVGVHFHTQA